MNDLAKAQRQVGDEVNRGDDFEDGKLGDGRERVGIQGESAGPCPHAPETNVFQVVANELANARAAVDVRLPESSSTHPTSPGADVAPQLFGTPVVATAAMLQGKFLVGAFENGVTLYDRMKARVEISTEDSDNFRKNLVTILAEERLALGVKAPTAFVKGDFAAALADLGA